MKSVDFRPHAQHVHEIEAPENGAAIDAPEQAIGMRVMAKRNIDHIRKRSWVQVD